MGVSSMVCSVDSARHSDPPIALNQELEFARAGFNIRGIAKILLNEGFGHAPELGDVRHC